jgi:hypothetical protein
MDGRVEKPLHGAVAIRAPAGDIAHSDVVGRTKRTGNDVAQLPEHGGGMDLTKGAKQCEYIHGFSLVFGVQIPKLYRKSHFYTTFNWRRYCYIVNKNSHTQQFFSHQVDFYAYIRVIKIKACK